MELVDARRLTGRSHLSPSPLVLVEIALDAGETAVDVEKAYVAELARMHEALGLPALSSFVVRTHVGGVVIGYETGIDTMLASVDVSEWAALSARAVLRGQGAHALEPRRSEIAQNFAEDENPKLVALQAEAAKRGVPFLWDDTHASVGAGKRSRTWPVAELPDVADVPWAEVGRIPIAFVTGTNGKTTSTRLLARIATESGAIVGSASSDAITIRGETVEEGDWSGPAAARVVLRHRDVEVAVLETARGGILRRGLAIDGCDAGLVTNVSDDHLGGYGIDDLDAMVSVKAVVADAVRPGGTVVLNAHDPKLVALAPRLAETRKVVFFADLERADAAAHDVVRAHHGPSVVARDGNVVSLDGGHAHTLARLADAPITFDGAARHNVENVLAAVAMARAIGIDDGAIARGIRGFAMTENAGRGELVERDGVRVLLDFAHNPDGVRAVLALTSTLLARRPGRLFVITGSAGDRTDHEIAEMARLVAEAKPHRVMVREVGDYLRGRAPGEVPELFRRGLARSGLAADAFAIGGSELEALQRALAEARPGDLVALLIHLDRDEIRAFLSRP